MDSSNINGIDITPEGSVAPTYLIELTEEELAVIAESQQDFAVVSPEKLSALEKLKKLGLTEAEAKAIIGI